MTAQKLDLPPLPLAPWADTKETLHLFLQIVGKIRMALHPKLNHWWHVTLYPAARGFTTGRIPYGDTDFEITFDFLDHHLSVSTSAGRLKRFDIRDLSVAGFYHAVFAALRECGIEAKILAKPYDRPDTTPFAEDETHASYDPDAVHRYWRAVSQIAGVLENFRGRFLGKTTPVHLFWHSMDLALTRFSGRAAPMEGGSQADREAYSHEVISFGFWAGDDTVPEAAFYSYVYPEPEGLAQEPLAPGFAKWVEARGSTMAFMTYEALRKSADPKTELLNFLQSAYEAGAKRADWPRAELDAPWAEQ